MQPMLQAASNRRIGLAQIHLAAILAGGSGLFGKLLAVSPAVLTTGRTVVGCLALLLFAQATGTSLQIASRRDALILVCSGVLLAAHWLTFFGAIQVSTVAIGLLAFSTFPLFTTLLEPLVFHERLRRRDMLTAIVVTAGLILVTPNLDVHDHLTQGVLLGVTSALLYAVLSLLSRTCSARYPAITVSFYQQAVAALCTLPFSLVWQGHLSARDIALLLLLGIVFTALGQALVVGSLRHIRAQTASVVIGLEPVYAILFAWLLLHEVPALRTLFGGILICGAVFTASLAPALRRTG